MASRPTATFATLGSSMPASNARRAMSARSMVRARAISPARRSINWGCRFSSSSRRASITGRVSCMLMPPETSASSSALGGVGLETNRPSSKAICSASQATEWLRPMPACTSILLQPAQVRMALSPSTCTVQSANAWGEAHSSQIGAPSQVLTVLVVSLGARLRSRL